MHELVVQTFLKTHTFGELAKEWGVYARCDKFGYKFSLNYDMIEFTPGHVPSEQCRGLILAMTDERVIPNVNGKVDENFCPGETVVMAYPFDKFYNEQESHAANIDWQTANVMDKMDGTLCIMYWDSIKSDWCVATRSVPDADMSLDGWEDWSFRKLFEKGVEETLGVTMSEWVSSFDAWYRQNTWMFELTSPYNRVFVDYKDTRITFLGIRNLVSLEERDPDTFILCSPLDGMRTVARPTTWSLRGVDAVQEYVNNRAPDECEGAVIVDGDFNRIKIKNPKWVLANATKTSLGASPRNLMRYVLMGISDDITSMLPEDLRQRLFNIRDGMKFLFKETDTNFAMWKTEAGSDRKRFAELVNVNAKWIAPHFKMYEGKFQSSAEFVSDMVARDKLGDAMIDTLLKLVTHSYGS